MKKILSAIVMLLLCACAAPPPPMTNDQIIAVTKQCTDAGLRTLAYSRGGPLDGDDRIVFIQCAPKENHHE